MQVDALDKDNAFGRKHLESRNSGVESNGQPSIADTPSNLMGMLESGKDDNKVDVGNGMEAAENGENLRWSLLESLAWWKYFTFSVLF